MLLTAENFYETLNTFRVLSDRIDSVDTATFKRVYGSDEADRESNIVYVYRTRDPIPRVKGESDVVYIGETKGTFKQRYLTTAKGIATSEANRMKYEHLISNYDPIRITLTSYNQFGDTLKQAEGQLLWWYFQNHCEYPPVNYTKTNVRNKVISID